MDKVYSRNIAHRQLFPQNSPKALFRKKSADSGDDGPLVFSEDQFTEETSSDTEFKGLKQADCALNIWQQMGESVVVKKGRRGLRVSFGEIVVSNDHVATSDRAQSITAKIGTWGILIFRSADVERLNYRFAAESLVEDEALLHIFKIRVSGRRLLGSRL